MSKIIRAVNKMIENKEKITNVIAKQNECFFLYDHKYKWSIGPYQGDKGSGYFFLAYYKDDSTLQQISALGEIEYEFLEMIVYNTKELKSVEALESFQELYRTVKEKLYNFDDVLDDIIKDDDEDPF